MKWSALQFSAKEVIAICTIVLSIGLAWADLQYDVQEVKQEVKALRGTVQWLLGEAIREGWTPPGNWVLPSELDE